MFDKNKLLLTFSVVFFVTVVYLKLIREPAEITDCKILQQTINVGNRFPNQEIDTIFEIINTGNSTFKIENVIADCHCTTPFWTNSKVNAGGRAIVRVKYDNENVGYFQQNIKVFANVKNSPVVLVLKGRTIKDTLKIK